MLMSAAELKRQLISGYEKDADAPPEWESKKKDYAEVGQHVKRMTGTNGWKILETWLLRQLDINVILNGTDMDRLRAKAFGDVIRQVNHWVTVGERASSELEPPKSGTTD
jgi:hypothetical protein